MKPRLYQPCDLLPKRPEFHQPSICSAHLEDSFIGRTRSWSEQIENSTSFGLPKFEEARVHKASADDFLLKSWKDLEALYDSPQPDPNEFVLSSVEPYQKLPTSELKESFARFPLVKEISKTKLKRRQVMFPPLNPLNPKKTLILDLDETLIYTSRAGGILLIY